MIWRIGVDIGGTFTDFALLNEATSQTRIHKVLTTPNNPAAAVIGGILKLLAVADVEIAEVQAIVHGTTLVTNAIIERKGATVGMLVTAGFSDVLDIGRELRYDMFDLRQRFPNAVVSRQLRKEVQERVRYDGTVEKSLDLPAVRAAIADLVDRGRIQALAVCLLHSYANPVHEQAIAKLAAADFPDLPVSISAEVCPQIREFERWTTTTINAYAQPMVDRYLGQLQDELATLGFRGQLYVMTSSGGTVLPSIARRYPVRLLESGPAAGALMAATLGRRLGARDILAFDMGGTTAKGCIIRSNRPLRRYDFEVARLHEFKRGSGLPLKIPVIDMIEIGSGGGSVAAVDALGVLRVGPESAGADPGPCCYGRGGIRATLTDANLVLGIYDPHRFLGGKMRLDPGAARSAITKQVGASTGIDCENAAAGIHEIINEDVARAFRIHASERGVDYRNCIMIAFGGSGPAHAIRIARKLRIGRVVIARGAGVFSALGLLATPLAFEIVRSDAVPLTDIGDGWWQRYIAPLVAEASTPLRQAGVTQDAIRIHCRLDMRYLGQGHDVEVSLPDNAAQIDAAGLLELFEARYTALYMHSLPEFPMQIVTWKVEAVGPDPLPGRPIHVENSEGDTTRTWKGGDTRLVHVVGAGFISCPVYDRVSAAQDVPIMGPALIEEPESTCLIEPGDVAHIDAERNLVVDLAFRTDAAISLAPEPAL